MFTLKAAGSRVPMFFGYKIVSEVLMLPLGEKLARFVQLFPETARELQTRCDVHKWRRLTTEIDFRPHIGYQSWDYLMLNDLRSTGGGVYPHTNDVGRAPQHGMDRWPIALATESAEQKSADEELLRGFEADHLPLRDLIDDEPITRPVWVRMNEANEGVIFDEAWLQRILPGPNGSDLPHDDLRYVGGRGTWRSHPFTRFPFNDDRIFDYAKLYDPRVQELIGKGKIEIRISGRADPIVLAAIQAYVRKVEAAARAVAERNVDKGSAGPYAPLYGMLRRDWEGNADLNQGRPFSEQVFREILIDRLGACVQTRPVKVLFARGRDIVPDDVALAVSTFRNDPLTHVPAVSAGDGRQTGQALERFWVVIPSPADTDEKRNFRFVLADESRGGRPMNYDLAVDLVEGGDV